eukprot:2990728-Lingulodinium_polyedra.AAC.1
MDDAKGPQPHLVILIGSPGHVDFSLRGDCGPADYRPRDSGPRLLRRLRRQRRWPCGGRWRVRDAAPLRVHGGPLHP